jgi:O-antigen ligase
LLLFLSDLVFRARDVDAIRKEAVDGWALYRISLIALTACTLTLRLALKKTLWTRDLFRGLIGALTLYACISLASTLWSVYPAWTAYKAFEYMVDLSLVAAIVTVVKLESGFKSLLDWTYAMFGALLAAVWLGVLLWPQAALRRDVGEIGLQLYGVLPDVHANTVGELGAILAVVAFSRAVTRVLRKREAAWYGFVFAAGLVSVAFSQTRSAILGLLLGLVLILLLLRPRWLFVLVPASSLLLFATSLGESAWLFLQRGQSAEAIESLSGRMDWWEYAWHEFSKHPWTGLGAYAGSRFDVLAGVGATYTSSVHNTYLEVIVGTGFGGLVPVIFALAGTWWVLLRASRRPRCVDKGPRLAPEAIGVLSVVTVRSFFTAHLIWHPSLAFLMLVGYAEFLRRNKESRSAAVSRNRALRMNPSAV